MKQTFAGLCLLVVCTPVPARAQTRPATQVAFVIRVASAPFFDPTGDPGAGADARARRIASTLRRIRSLEGLPLALAVSPVLCDEARLLRSPGALELLRELRRLGARSVLLVSPYADARLPGLPASQVRRELSDGRAAAERCVDRATSNTLFPPDLRLDAGVVAAARGGGLERTFHAQSGGSTIGDMKVIPAIEVEEQGQPDELVEGLTASGRVAVVVDVQQGNVPELLSAAVDDPRLSIVSLNKLDAGLPAFPGYLPEEPAPAHLGSVERAQGAVERLVSFTLHDNRLVAVLRTAAARVAGSAEWDGRTSVADGRSRALVRTVAAQTALVSVDDGAVTFTARQGSLPIAISNRASYPVKIRVTVDSPKLTFPADATREVVIDPPGEVVTFEAIARSTGTFPTQATATSRDGSVSFGSGEVIVRSTAANLSAVVLTVGGALFLVAWFINRLRRKPHERAS